MTTKICFLDTSAFTKLFVLEIGSQDLHNHLESLINEQKTFPVLAQVEARSAFQRRLRNRQMTANQLLIAISELDLVVSVWPIVPLNYQVVEASVRVVARHALRSLDAIQLGSALALRDDLAPNEEVLFIACDERLLNAAIAEGLAVWNPETAAAP